ncbi:hypothetical protein EG68_07917 [Paragonimus skrjabini miyazakii]|uniref:Uncharacterized protein n=1 Tax=Paragonimus skrjabini miyazakii TaxID=59628 RepID=A0A8S9YVY2_9TREM|nr:hypothetical protein EG68_07917 [Paragonimus skrjabini miyazakii]
MAKEVGSPTKKDDFEPPVIPFREGCPVLFTNCQSPAIKPPPSFDSDTNLPLWRREVGLYIVNIPTDNQEPYIFSLLSDNVQEVLWASDLSTAATTTAIWSKLEELYPVPDNRAESRTTFWSHRQLLEETVEDYVNQLRRRTCWCLRGSSKEPPTDLSCPIRLARSYAKSAELVSERDDNCMAVKPLAAPISIRDHMRAQHWDPSR